MTEADQLGPRARDQEPARQSPSQSRRPRPQAPGPRPHPGQVPGCPWTLTATVASRLGAPAVCIDQVHKFAARPEPPTPPHRYLPTDRPLDPSPGPRLVPFRGCPKRTDGRDGSHFSPGWQRRTPSLYFPREVASRILSAASPRPSAYAAGRQVCRTSCVTAQRHSSSVQLKGPHLQGAHKLAFPSAPPKVAPRRRP
ncbi:MAG: hypothetical protein ACJAQ3_000867 [Planctomycetota bacterium]|jgi:hypothetical protein